jgi:hypothetical protein
MVYTSVTTKLRLKQEYALHISGLLYCILRSTQKHAYLNTIYNKNTKYIRRNIDLVLTTTISDIILSYILVPLDAVNDCNDGPLCLKVINNTKDFFVQSLDKIKTLALLKQMGKRQHWNYIIEMRR